MPSDGSSRQTLCAEGIGFARHAAVSCGADDRQGLEQLCRDLTRPALANKRLQTKTAGQVVLRLQAPWHDASGDVAGIHAAPGPRLHLVRFGVRITSPCAVSGLPLCEPWRAGTRRESAHAGSSARAHSLKVVSYEALRFEKYFLR